MSDYVPCTVYSRARGLFDAVDELLTTAQAMVVAAYSIGYTGEDPLSSADIQTAMAQASGVCVALGFVLTFEDVSDQSNDPQDKYQIWLRKIP